MVDHRSDDPDPGPGLDDVAVEGQGDGHVREGRVDLAAVADVDLANVDLADQDRGDRASSDEEWERGGPVSSSATLHAAARRALQRLVDEQVDQLLEELAEHDSAVEDALRAAARGCVRATVDAELAAIEAPALLYDTSAQWLSGFLLPHWRRDPSVVTWCPRWFEHAEAVSRIEALWRAWETMRTEDATAIATWWLSYADPHLRELTDAHGPFHGCKRGHRIPDMLPVDPHPDMLPVDPHPDMLPVDPHPDHDGAGPTAKASGGAWL